MSNTKIITDKYGDKVARLTMTLNLDIYLGEEENYEMADKLLKSKERIKKL
jgi:hypothetical protein